LFAGTIDHVRIYNTALSQTTIQQNMFKQIDPGTSGLVAYWRFNENTGTTAYDETTNNNDGTLGGGTASYRPTWTTGFIPDAYNEAEGVYTVDASGSQIQVDIDGGSDTSTTLNGGLTAGSTTVTVASTTGFPASGVAYIEGDKFSYTGTTSTTFTGVPSSGELSVVGYPGITFVQATSVYSSGSLTLNGVAAGNLLVAFVSGSTTCASTTISDDKSNSWNSLTNRTGDAGSARIFYALNVASGNTIISVTNPPGDAGWSVHEYSGIATTSAFDTENSNFANATNFSSGNVITSQADELLVSIAMNETNPSVITWTGSFDERTEQSTHVHGTADRIVTSTGTYAATGSWDASCYYGCLIAAFKAAMPVVSSMNRHKPNFKIRNYRQNSKPSSVTMEGASLVEGTNYNVDYKPVSDAYFADELTWYSTLESSAAVTSPDIGTGASNTGATYIVGKYGNGAYFDAGADNLYWTMSSDLNTSKGAIEFWYKPNSASNDNAEKRFFEAWNTSDWTDYIRFVKSTNNYLYFTIYDGTTTFQTSLPDTSYSWSAGDWVHLKVDWDEDAVVADQMRIFINGVEPNPHNDDTDNYSDASLLVHDFYISGDTDARDADGIIDEFRIYGGEQDNPDKLAEGGDTADTDEYLFDEENDYILDFDPVDADATERGEYLFLGADTMFAGVNVDLATNGASSGSLNLVWEYWNGTSWADLESISGFTDGSSNLTTDGAIYWDANPTNWRPYSVNGSTDLYYIRASLKDDSGTYTTDPVENFIKTDILILQYLGNITSDNQTLVVVPEKLLLWLLLAPVLPLVIRKKSKNKKKSV
ncbi:MAG TPA: LamG-like jellyroll fold domain-containing protein, partial [Candidatus Bathyarchaeia archaeon]|nr:LamG-like jellyroll fold domain-containing protein [Candidatus Bathyarchaeia archaeon]